VISVITGTAVFEQATAIRTRVFVEEQGVPLESEFDELDVTAEHFVALVGAEPAGTARLMRSGAVAILGRLAVLRPGRGTGVGVALVTAIEERAIQLGLLVVELHSQTHACGFYERMGYRAYGEQDVDAGIPHIWMRKQLAPGAGNAQGHS
jgi:predicted GNAT family N-acyltransferase